MADFGYIALLLAFIASLYTIAAFVLGAGKRPDLLESARNGLITVCALMTVAAGSMLFSILTHDFSVEYVASYTNRALSTPFLLSAFWAGNAGSLLFWAWALSIVAITVVLIRWKRNRDLIPWASAIMMATEALFLLLLLFVANPFAKLPFTPADGNGLNPLLQNPGMLFHPPTLLFGYLGFAVPFAFAVAALITGKLDDEWINSTRPWTILAWLSLGIGNLLGAWWAYVELGWGGYWAWDPVENAGLMPWLIATAFLHSVVMQRRRGIFKTWNMALIVITFSLTMFSTVLVRSGLSQAHGFSEADKAPLYYFLTFILLTLAGSIALMFYRRNQLAPDEEVESLLSRESTFMINNLLLLGACAVVFIGTMFPAISQAFTGSSIGLDRSFFDTVAAPVLLAVILLIGVCAVIGWKRANLHKLARVIIWPLAASIVISAVLFVLGTRDWLPIAATFICIFVGLTMLYEILRGAWARHKATGENPFSAFFLLVWANKPRYGGYIVHIAVILIALGIVGSSFYQIKGQATLEPGQSMTVGKYTLTYEGVDTTPISSTASLTNSPTLSIIQSGEQLASLKPSLSFYENFGQVTDVGIHSTLLEDLYVIPQSIEQDGTASFEVVVNPLVMFMWIGSIALFVGGVISFWPDRKKRPVKQEAPTTNKKRTAR